MFCELVGMWISSAHGERGSQMDSLRSTQAYYSYQGPRCLARKSDCWHWWSPLWVQRGQFCLYNWYCGRGRLLHLLTGQVDIHHSTASSCVAFTSVNTQSTKSRINSPAQDHEAITSATSIVPSLRLYSFQWLTWTYWWSAT